MKEKRVYSLKENGQIVGYKWSSQTPKANIVICHGMAEHIERYDEFATFLTNNNFNVYGHNQRGHKDTSTKENYGYMSEGDNLQILVDDLHDIIEIIKSENPELPVYLFGHSMGSFVSQRLIEIYPNIVDKVILSGSNLQPTIVGKVGSFVASIITKSKGRKYQSKLMDNLSFGSFNKVFKPNRTDYDWLNRDDAEVDKYIADPWCGGIFTVSFFKDFTKLFVHINKNFKNISKELPILLISGDKDPVGGCGKGINNLLKEMKKHDLNVSLKMYKDARHELTLELCKEEVFNDVLNFYN